MHIHIHPSKDIPSISYNYISFHLIHFAFFLFIIFSLSLPLQVMIFLNHSTYIHPTTASNIFIIYTCVWVAIFQCVYIPMRWSTPCYFVEAKLSINRECSQCALVQLVPMLWDDHIHNFTHSDNISHSWTEEVAYSRTYHKPPRHIKARPTGLRLEIHFYFFNFLFHHLFIYFYFVWVCSTCIFFSLFIVEFSNRGILHRLILRPSTSWLLLWSQ